MTAVNHRFSWPDLRPGATLDGSVIETVGRMHALVYFGKGDYRVVPDRPIVCTEHDVLARVRLVHRCGTDVKIFQSGRPDQAEESLLEELAALIGSARRGDSTHFLRYVKLLQTGRSDGWSDGLYGDVAAAVRDTSDADRAAMWRNLHLHWGRIFGHETVVEVVRVGRRVRELTQGIGYMQGCELGRDYLDFQVGERCCLQSRIAHYQRALVGGGSMRGVQLLGGNITDLAMNQAGAFAQYVRLRPQVIQSGSVLRVPGEVDDVSAALVEPLACLLDCFQKTTHELGQDERGSVLRKGVLPGGVTLIIGSGAMAMMAGKLALVSDDRLELGGAREVVFVVRSEAKGELVRQVMGIDARVRVLVCPSEAELPAMIREQYEPREADPYGREFRGFDDVILAAGSAATVAVSHQLIAPTGARIMTFAGTRGQCSVESGVWHYANAGVLGTSGCNTRMMELALGLLARRSIDLRPLTGKTYRFSDLIEQGTAAFFIDQHLRPKLDPNDGLPEVKWE
jgi:threonine dehydrogenase-like Zn-dependent dehydrogenase